MGDPHIGERCFGIANQEPSFDLDGHQSAFLARVWLPLAARKSTYISPDWRSSRMTTMIIVGDHGRHAA